MFQLFVGEIGIPRHVFYYELRWWEVKAIIRGYRRRNRLTHQLIAECVYAVTFSMRDPKGKTVKDMFPILFKEEEEEVEKMETPNQYLQYIEKMQHVMSDINNRGTGDI